MTEDPALTVICQRERLLGILTTTLPRLRRPHLVEGDCWYSCPKSGDCCDDERDTNHCDCGADAHNAIIDAALAEVCEALNETGDIPVPAP